MQGGTALDPAQLAVRTEAVHNEALNSAIGQNRTGERKRRADAGVQQIGSPQ